ncbi:MAG: hypothetical protein JNL43_09615 [Flavobacteriales bacterium]|nr:hypothetical protein [Flavobacteriales bacterium]
MIKRRPLVWLVGLGVVGVILYFLLVTKKAVVDLGPANEDAMKAYALASDVAHDWHRAAFPGSVTIAREADDRVSLIGYFYGKGPFQPHTDVFTVEVDMVTNKLIRSDEGKGRLEPNYDNARPLNVHLVSGWREVLRLADDAYGSGFQQRFGDTQSFIGIENDRWYVSYVSDSAGFRVSMTGFDSSSHPSIANTVQINDSVTVKTGGRNSLPG